MATISVDSNFGSGGGEVPLAIEMTKDQSLSLNFSYSLDPDTDTFISENLIPSDVDAGMTVTSNSVSGNWQQRLQPSDPPPIKWVDSDKNEQESETYDEVPIGEPNYYTLSSYTSPTLLSETVSYTYEMTYLYEPEAEEGMPEVEPYEVTISETVEITIRNQWDGDANNVANASSGGGGKPTATISSATSGHATWPPTAPTAASSKVFIVGEPALRHGDPLAPHTSTVSPHPTHAGSAVGGSPKVLIEGKVAVRVGDNGSCGGKIAQGKAKVLTN